MNTYIIRTYASLVNRGMKSIDDVPENIRESVEQILSIVTFIKNNQMKIDDVPEDAKEIIQRLLSE